jgi:hypothetical protein
MDNNEPTEKWLLDNYFDLFRRQVIDTFTHAVKKAIEENRAAGIPDEDLMPPPSQ